MNNNNLNEKCSPGLKKLCIGFVAERTPYGVEEARWKAMKSILMTLVMSDAIRIDVMESNGETIVTGYTFVESHLKEPPVDEKQRLSYKAIRKVEEKYPFVNSLLETKFVPKIKK